MRARAKEKKSGTLATARRDEAKFQTGMMGAAESVGYREQTADEAARQAQAREKVGLAPKESASMKKVQLGTAEQQIRAQEMKRARENEAAARESMMEESMTGTGVVNNAPTMNNSSSKQTTISSTQLAPMDQNTRASLRAAIY